MDNFFAALAEFWVNTNIPDQLQNVDVRGAFTNPWLLVPLIAQVGWWIYKQNINAIIFLALAIGVWIFSGSPYAHGLVVNGNLQLGKVLPVAGVGMGVVMVVVYLLFMRGD
jgi:hypothetical protein